MTVDNLIALGRTQTHTVASQVSDANGLIFLNRAYQKAVGRIISQMGEGFFRTTWLIDAVAAQANGAYTFSAVSPTVAGVRRIERLDIKPTTSYSNYIPATEVRESALPTSSQDWDWHLTNQPTDRPIFFLSSTQIFIAPGFTSATAGGAGNNQIKITGIQNVIDLLAAGAESTVLIPTPYHPLLALGMEEWIYRSLGKLQESTKAKQDYEEELNRMISELSDRIMGSDGRQIPDEIDRE